MLKPAWKSLIQNSEGLLCEKKSCAKKFRAPDAANLIHGKAELIYLSIYVNSKAQIKKGTHCESCIWKQMPFCETTFTTF